MEAIKKLRKIGYDVFPEGEKVRCIYTGEGMPDPELVIPLFSEIKKHKPEAMAYLQLEAETRKALRQIKKKGYAKIWSEKIGKEVYFIDTPKDRPKIPIEGVAFTLTELRELTARKVSPEELKEIYDKRDLSIPPEPIQRSREA